MDATHYIFAFYLFVLLLALLFVYVKLMQPKTKGPPVNPEADKKLFSMYQNLDDLIDSLEAYIEQSKREIVQEREEMARLLAGALTLHQQDLVEAAPLVEQAPDQGNAAGQVATSEQSSPDNKQEAVIRLNNRGAKREQIARELQITSGEVMLILEAHKKNQPNGTLL